MASFFYKLEFVYDDNSSSDASVFIQMRNNPPIYQARITKEAYDILPTNQKNDFLTHLFAFGGVVEVSTTAYRIWFMKSPVYHWDEILTPMLFYLTAYFNYTDFQPLPGSGLVDGSGFTLQGIGNRRKI